MSFAGSSISEWTLALNTCDNKGGAEEESLNHSIDSDNRIEAMVFDAPNSEEAVKEDGLEVDRVLFSVFQTSTPFKRVLF